MKKILLLLCLYSAFATAQTGGEQVYQFLNLTTSARQAALGGEIYTLTDDVNQPLWNPSTINEDMHNNVGVNYVNYLAGISFGSASYAYKFNDKLGTFHAGVTYVGYGELIGTDAQGNETGTFKANDFSVSLGYAYHIPNSHFFVGANLKMINSVIDSYSSFGLATDLGVLYKNKEKPYSFTLVLKNLGTQITKFDNTKEDLPFEIALSADYQLENVPLKWYLTLDNLQQWEVAYRNPSNATVDIEGKRTEEDITFFDNAFRHVIIGAELFPKKAFNIRVGYNVRRGKELKLVDARTFAGFSAGFGLKLNRIKFNYAFTKYHPADNASTFSLLINLN
ncbi:type IX secretion system protein PorQ [Aureivirga sp. CE67]|uniref:type IX secretion system protein PorQ n=1 Tax=Aureivirga sp. CE67 TaxID=1788983 RepID=UPI0018C8FE6E|nr:type IX secretion system protein PorQ [Aureivirga sp. CE67]